MYQHPARDHETSASHAGPRAGTRAKKSPREIVGAFAWSRFASNGLEEIAELIYDRGELSEQDILRLQDLPLAYLGKLISLRSSEENIPATPKALLRPLLCLPLAEEIERRGADSAVETVRGILES